ncbi:TetR/AcrR family transcriptional regulator [Acidipropionibacterium timonense]|uniref:TetR/AcrR family transcriptional regulator n=1 Tax=Acidipropionibacterium timonense TaxID=2161818 RepID=UPI00143672C4|nr:TetR/AcrR family transcriptional regulator [Acidipropionibacterium timonense]
MVESQASGKTTRQGRRDRTRSEIMSAAIPLFADQGYGLTSMDQVAQAAGVSKGLIFHTFGSKAGLFEAIFQTFADRALSCILEAREGKVGFAALDAITGSLLHLVCEHPTQATIILTEMWRADRPWQEVTERFRRSVTDPVAQVVGEVYQDRRKAGLVDVDRSQEDFETVAQAYFGAAVVAGLDHVLRNPQGSVDDLHATVRVAMTSLVRTP